MQHARFSTPFVPAVARPAPRLKTVHLPALDLDLVDATTQATVDALLSPGRKRVFFMNAHCCNIRRRDPAYAQAVAAADFLLPDGIGVELAGKMTGQALTENLNGTDFTPRLLAQAARAGKSVYLFGGTPGTAQAAATKLSHQIPGLRIAGTRDGYGGASDAEAAINAINDSGADIVLVAMGVPLQENWLHAHAHRLDAPLTLAVGALFDFLAGKVVRAPRLVRKLRLEWGWRLAQEPRRLANRYLAGNLSFLMHASKTVLRQIPAVDHARRALDIAVAGVTVPVLLPILLLTALAIRLDSPGPVLFRQTRIGKKGRPFTIYKFRSMTTDAETRRDALLDQSDRDGVCFKARNDPRVTRIGRLIRRCSIDELPQILNVLKGEMSIVGPRPALPSEVAAYPPRALGRLAVKPGITGVWQVSGRANIDFAQMVEMDIAYTASRSVLMDIILILRTIPAVLTARGAY